MNTGVPGYKLKGGQSLPRISSGFDRNYVIVSTLRDHQIEDQRIAVATFERLTGLSELSPAEREAMKTQVEKILSKPKTTHYSQAVELDKLLARIEEMKMAAIKPQRHVST